VRSGLPMSKATAFWVYMRRAAVSIYYLERKSIGGLSREIKNRVSNIPLGRKKSRKTKNREKK